MQKIFTILFLSTQLVVHGTVFGIVAPLLPLQLAARGLPYTINGLCFSIFSVAAILFPPVSAYSIQKLGRMQTIVMGSLVMGITFAIFGFAEFLENKDTFVALILFSRVLQGMCAATIFSTTLSIIMNVFPQEKDSLSGKIQMAQGLGCLLGPVLGSFFLTVFSFSMAYFIEATIFFTLTALAPIFLSNVENTQVLTSAHFENDHESQILNRSDQESLASIRTVNAKVGYVKILTNHKLMLTCLFGLVGNFLWSFLEPIYVLRIKEFNLGSMEVGFFFAILPLAYTIGAVISSNFSEKLEKPQCLQLYTLVGVLAMVLLGPSEILRLKDSLLLIGIGSVLLGIAIGGILSLALPETIDMVQKLWPSEANDLREMIVTIYTQLIGIGLLLGPLYGAMITQAIGYRLMCDYLAIFLASYGVLYFLSMRRNAKPQGKDVDIQEEFQQL